MPCSWAIIEKPEPVKFEDIMSEDAKKRKLQEKTDEKIFTPDDGVKSDAVIAHLHQIECDKKHDYELKCFEKKPNRTSNVSTSLMNYFRAPSNRDSESKSKEEVDNRDKEDLKRYDLGIRELDSIPPCGYKRKDGIILTKHDATLKGRKNAYKLLHFPPEFQTGDGEKFDLKLSDKALNSRKLYVYNEKSRKHKIQDKKEGQAIPCIFGVDESTNLLFSRMVRGHLLQSINGRISSGKEAVIFHANTDPSYSNAVEPLPNECAIKVFRNTVSAYKRDKFIEDDNRLKDKIRGQRTRKTVHLWAEKEMSNLTRLRRSGVPCPQVVKLKRNVLVMSFIGENHSAAHKLKNAVMTDVDYIMAYKEVVKWMKTIYEEANLIHADLSEYNILWHNKQCYFIDVSQSVEPCHENAFEYLHNDCINVSNFFTRKGVPKTATPDELFKFVTGYDFSDKTSFSHLQKSFKMKPHLVNRPGFESTFDFNAAWEKSKAEQTGRSEGHHSTS